MAIPAVLCVAQNNVRLVRSRQLLSVLTLKHFSQLQYVAASNLDIPTFQVVFSMKVFTGAVMSALILHRRLSLRRWLALFALAIGIATVQLPPSNFEIHAGHENLDRVRGLTAAALACILAGTTGAFVELALHRSEADLWARNIQLSGFAVLPALVPVFFPSSMGGFAMPADFSSPAALDGWAWIAIGVQVAGSVLASAMGSDDALVKITATGLSTLLVLLVGATLFGYVPSATFALGAVLVLLATFSYSQSERGPAGRFTRRGKPAPVEVAAPPLHSPLLSPPVSPLWGNAIDAHPALAALRNAKNRLFSPPASDGPRLFGFGSESSSLGSPSLPNSPEDLVVYSSYSFDDISVGQFIPPSPEIEVPREGRSRVISTGVPDATAPPVYSYTAPPIGVVGMKKRESSGLLWISVAPTAPPKKSARNML